MRAKPPFIHIIGHVPMRTLMQEAITATFSVRMVRIGRLMIIWDSKDRA